MKFLKYVLLSLILLNFVIGGQGLNADQNDDQWQKVIIEQEKLANKSITDSYNQIAKMSYLAQKKVQNPSHGVKLKVKKTEGQVIFELKGYEYDKDIDSSLTGFKIDILLIYFKENKIEKVERIYTHKEFNSESSVVLRIVDNAPLDENHNDIEITRTKNEIVTIKSKFGDFKNSPGNQERTNFKSIYSEYIKSLAALLNRIAFQTIMNEQNNQNVVLKNFPPILSY